VALRKSFILSSFLDFFLWDELAMLVGGALGPVGFFMRLAAPEPCTWSRRKDEL